MRTRELCWLVLGRIQTQNKNHRPWERLIDCDTEATVEEEVVDSVGFPVSAPSDQTPDILSCGDSALWRPTRAYHALVDRTGNRLDVASDSQTHPPLPVMSSLDPFFSFKQIPFHQQRGETRCRTAPRQRSRSITSSRGITSAATFCIHRVST